MTLVYAIGVHQLVHEITVVSKYCLSEICVTPHCTSSQSRAEQLLDHTNQLRRFVEEVGRSPAFLLGFTFFAKFRLAE